MSTWKERSFNVMNDLRLDPKNVRLDSAESVTESDIIHDLFENESAFSVLDSISKAGFLTHELPVVVKRGKEWVVVEGNRRVAALKAIQNPQLAPSHKSRIETAVKRIADREALADITAKIAPSQKDANALIAILHIGNDKERWTRARQAAFFQAQLDAGDSPEDLIARYPTINVGEFIVRSRIMELFKAVKYGDPELVDYVNRARFPVTTLERLYQNPAFLDIVGLEVDYQSGNVRLRTPKKTFAPLANQIIRDMADRHIDTRRLNSTSRPEYKQYLDRLRDVSNGIDVNESTDEENSKSKRAGTLSGKKAKDKKQNDRRYLGVEDLPFPSKLSDPVQEIYSELDRLNVETFPNAAMDLLRTFTEKSIKSFAEAQGEVIPPRNSNSKYVYLGDALLWLEKRFLSLKDNARVQATRRLRGKLNEESVGTKEHHDSINHNHLVGADPTEAREAWKKAVPVLKYLFEQ